MTIHFQNILPCFVQEFVSRLFLVQIRENVKKVENYVLAMPGIPFITRIKCSYNCPRRNIETKAVWKTSRAPSINNRNH